MMSSSPRLPPSSRLLARSLPPSLSLCPPVLLMDHSSTHTLSPSSLCHSLSLTRLTHQVTFHTMNTSALNAEELRRENGIVALQAAFARCVDVLSASSSQDDMAVQVSLLLSASL